MKLINYIKLYLFIFLKKTLFKFKLFESFYNEFLNQEKFLDLIKKKFSQKNFNECYDVIHKYLKFTNVYTYKVSNVTLSKSFENFKYNEDLKKKILSVNEIYNNHEYVPKFVKFNNKNILKNKFSDNKINLVTNLNVDGNICESDIAFSFVESSKKVNLDLNLIPVDYFHSDFLNENNKKIIDNLADFINRSDEVFLINCNWKYITTTSSFAYFLSKLTDKENIIFFHYDAWGKNKTFLDQISTHFTKSKFLMCQNNLLDKKFLNKIKSRLLLLPVVCDYNNIEKNYPTSSEVNLGFLGSQDVFLRIVWLSQIKHKYNDLYIEDLNKNEKSLKKMLDFYKKFKNFNLSLNFSSRNKVDRLVVGRVFESIAHRHVLLEEKNPSIDLFLLEYLNFIPINNVNEVLLINDFFIKNQNIFKQIIKKNIHLTNKYFNAKFFWDTLRKFIN